MDITLIRHTKVETEQGICYGKSNVSLAQSFEIELHEIANKIQGIGFDVIYSSPLLRCRELAENLFCDKEVNYDDRLMEMDFGQWEGQKWDDIFNTEEGKVFFSDYVNTICPGGESYTALIERIKAFYLEIKTKHKGNKIAIVTHGGSIRAFMHILEDVPPEETFEKSINFGEVLRFDILCE
jgi:alpha-ribazole phosphatase